MLPESGARLPEIRPTSVVLPAPFGPISACTVPAGTWSATWSTATTPPNRLLRLASESTGDPLWSEQHHGEQDHAHRQLPILRIRAEQLAAREQLFQREQRHRADRPAPEAADAAENDHDHQRPGLHPVQQRRADVAGLVGDQRAGKAGDRPRDDEAEQLVAVHRVADRGGARLVLADRLDDAAEAGGQQAVQQIKNDY